MIVSTADRQFALGLLSNDRPVAYGHRRYTNERVMKLNCVFRSIPAPAADYTFTCYSVIGTLDDVVQAMGKLVSE